MNVNIEFFDTEPLENMITCINYKMDKVVYFGHSNTMTPEKINATKKSLRTICGITDAEFIEVSQKNLHKVVELMEKEIQKVINAGGKCFFDLTGGEDLVLVAMGMLAAQYSVPMHKYALPQNELCILNKWDNVPILHEVVEKRALMLSLDDVISLYGGVINYSQQKAVKSNLDDKAFTATVKLMWEIANDNQRKWNALSSVFKECIKYENTDNKVILPLNEINRILNKYPDLVSVKELISYLKRLVGKGILKETNTDQKYIRFIYQNEMVRECLLDAGCLLELHTYYKRLESGKYSDCRVGVHIDWDGIINGNEVDVENEIDVMLLEGIIPTFISCKNGKVNQMAMYELDTVAGRFGGKYGRKELVATQEITRGYLKRAEEMNIVITMEE